MEKILKAGLIELLLEEFFKRIPQNAPIVLINKKTRQRCCTSFVKYQNGMVITPDGNFSLRGWYFNTAEYLQLRGRIRGLQRKLQKLEEQAAALRPPFPRKEVQK